jgi:hypothetical protein
VQVIVEGVEDNWAAGETLARAVYEELSLATVSGYVGIFPRDSQPTYLGGNLWAVNVEAHWAD